MYLKSSLIDCGRQLLHHVIFELQFFFLCIGHRDVELAYINCTVL